MANLGDRYAQGVLASGQLVNRVVSGAWVVQFKAQVLPSDSDFEVYHAAIRGPGGFFMVYLDDKLYGVSDNGRIAEYAPASAAMYVRKGQEITLHWSLSTLPAPQAWIYLREPEVGRL